MFHKASVDLCIAQYISGLLLVESIDNILSKNCGISIEINTVIDCCNNCACLLNNCLLFRGYLQKKIM